MEPNDLSYCAMRDLMWLLKDCGIFDKLPQNYRKLWIVFQYEEFKGFK